jgi:cobalamin-dependent methionine synthase I
MNEHTARSLEKIDALMPLLTKVPDSAVRTELVETAEALAEWVHCEIRREWGIASDDAAEIRKLFKKHYRGCRYSFGYPACPNLEDQAPLFKLIDPTGNNVWWSVQRVEGTVQRVE